MKKNLFYLIGLVSIIISACTKENDSFDVKVEIPDFNFPQTVDFESNLSAYNIFEDNPSDLIPANNFHLLELSAVLYTDHAYKQRLAKVPEGTQMRRLNDGSIDFPNGTLLTKTFFYYNDERDPSSGKKIIETRLLIKDRNTWNLATYLWNQDQTDATLVLNGHDKQISWLDHNGNRISTLYHIPNQNECMTCHQSNLTIKPLGPTLRNLNRMVDRNGASQNQISHLQSVGILNNFQVSQVSQIVDYKDLNVPLAERARAYLAMNCAHCHNPNAWTESAERDFDFRYETPLDQTGILYEKDKITEALAEGIMPFIGTTIIDQEGVNLIIEFVESL